MNKKRTLLIIITMISIALLAFATFYLFLIDAFHIFAPQPTSKGEVAIVDQGENTLSASQLDVDSEISPAHGDSATASAYPIEELTILTQQFCQWLQKEYASGAKEFPLDSAITHIASMRFSEGNKQPNVMEVPDLLLEALPIFLSDFLNIQGSPEKVRSEEIARSKPLQTFTDNVSKVLDCIRTIPTRQQKDFIEMARIKKNINKIEVELKSINLQIQEHAKKGEGDILPKLAEQKFTLQKNKEEQLLVLDRFESLFSSFYARAEIRHLPKAFVSSILTAFMEYAPEKNIKDYASKWYSVMDMYTSAFTSIILGRESCP